MDYSRIPEELKNQNQWVCAWDGSKVPMRAFERKAASSTAPDTWSTFEQAEWAVENGHYDHIGYVFADQNIVGIDIDSCRRGCFTCKAVNFCYWDIKRCVTSCYIGCTVVIFKRI